MGTPVGFSLVAAAILSLASCAHQPDDSGKKGSDPSKALGGKPPVADGEVVETFSAELSAARRPGKRYDCQASSTESDYTFAYQADTGRFDYPKDGPYDGQEVVLCISNPNVSKRYRLVFGAKTAGSDAIPAGTTVGYIPRETDTLLRGVIRKLANDETCDARPAKVGPKAGAIQPGRATGDEDRTRCIQLRKQVAALAEIAQVMILRRDAFAAYLLDLPPTAPMPPDALGPVSLSCSNDRMAAFIQKKLKDEKINLRVAWVDDSWHIIDRDPDSDAISIVPGPGGSGMTDRLVAYANTRAALIDAIQQAMDGCTRLMALKLRILEEVRMRQLHFRLGRFEGNKLIVATLEEHTAHLDLTEDAKHLVYRTETVPHQISQTVKKSTGYEVSFGSAYSFVPQPTYSLSSTANASGERTIVQSSDGIDMPPVFFVSFLWCLEDTQRSWWDRRCRGESENTVFGDWRHWMPRPTVGVPISTEFARGNSYVGLALPYIRYVSLIAGIHVRRVSKLRDSFDAGDSVASDSVPLKSVTRVGLFLGASVTEEILGLFLPKLEPAK